MIVRGRPGGGRAEREGVYVPTSLTTPSLLASQVFFWVAGLGSAILIDARVAVCCCWERLLVRQ